MARTINGATGRHEAQFVSRAPRSQLEHCLGSRTIVSVNTADRAIGTQKEHVGQRRVSDFEAITDAGGPLRDIERCAYFDICRTETHVGTYDRE